jgi:hypothetical protein
MECFVTLPVYEGFCVVWFFFGRSFAIYLAENKFVPQGLGTKFGRDLRELG